MMLPQELLYTAHDIVVICFPLVYAVSKTFSSYPEKFAFGDLAQCGVELTAECGVGPGLLWTWTQPT